MQAHLAMVPNRPRPRQGGCLTRERGRGYRSLVRPLAIVVLGLALAVLDFRTEALDLLPDALGWGLVALGAWRLGLLVAARLAVATGIASTADAWFPFHYIWVAPTGESPGSSTPCGTAPWNTRGWPLSPCSCSCPWS